MNHSPSFSVGSPLDLLVKEAVVRDTLRLLHISPSERERHQQHHQVGEDLPSSPGWPFAVPP